MEAVEERITVVCYGKKRIWASREAAKNFYLEGMLNSDGSERDRYTNIYLQLEAGANFCSDED